MAPALLSIRAAAKSMIEWTITVVMKAKAIAMYRDVPVEFSFSGGIDQTWLLERRRTNSSWCRLSLIDGGGRPVDYEEGIFAKFDEALSDVENDDPDPSLLFIATDGCRVYKAFTGPESAVGDIDPVFSTGFDDDVFIGIWSLAWMQRSVDQLEESDDPDTGWTELMEEMVAAIADYADTKSPPAAGSC